jgi:hypothetical protein
MFNLSNVEEQKKCFHYSNCRPLWAEDNLRRPKDGSDIVTDECQETSEPKIHEKSV